MLTKIRTSFTLFLVASGIVIVSIIMFNVGGGLSIFQPKPRIDAQPVGDDRDNVRYTLSAVWTGRSQNVRIHLMIAGRGYVDDDPEYPWDKDFWVKPGTHLSIQVSHTDDRSAIVCAIAREGVILPGMPHSRLEPGSVRCEAVAT